MLGKIWNQEKGTYEEKEMSEALGSLIFDVEENFLFRVDYEETEESGHWIFWSVSQVPEDEPNEETLVIVGLAEIWGLDHYLDEEKTLHVYDRAPQTGSD